MLGFLSYLHETKRVSGVDFISPA